MMPTKKATNNLGKTAYDYLRPQYTRVGMLRTRAPAHRACRRGLLAILRTRVQTYRLLLTVETIGKRECGETDGDGVSGNEHLHVTRGTAPLWALVEHGEVARVFDEAEQTQYRRGNLRR